jgi:hypothetical protein
LDEADSSLWVLLVDSEVEDDDSDEVDSHDEEEAHEEAEQGTKMEF